MPRVPPVRRTGSHLESGRRGTQVVCGQRWKRRGLLRVGGGVEPPLNAAVLLVFSSSVARFLGARGRRRVTSGPDGAPFGVIGAQKLGGAS